MNMSQRAALATQEIFCSLYNEYFPINFLYPITDNPHWNWQFTVEIIYRLYICSILQFEANEILIKTHDWNYDGIDDFCQQLASKDPDDISAELSLEWFGHQVSLTHQGYCLIDKYFTENEIIEINNYSYTEGVKIEFIEYLESIFHQHGVPWDEDNPTFPIHIQNESESANQ